MKKFLHHFFLPKESNNYRPLLLHHKILLILTLFFLTSGVLMSQIKTNFPTVLGVSSDISNQQLLLITNEKRQESGLMPLTLDLELSNAAASKATDMFSKDYWAHVSPSGETPWVFIQQAGYKYIYAGENLARGYDTAEAVVNAWMASPEHRQNMLSPNYKDVGFAVENGKLSGEDTVLVVEMFGSTTLLAAPNPNSQKSIEVSNSDSLSKTQPISQNEPNTLAARKVQTDSNIVNSSIIPANAKILINSATLSLNSAKIFVALFVFILLLDMILIERKKIIRFVGHNLDHIFFLTLILLAILILAKGGVV